MNEVQQRAAKALSRDPAIELIEYQREWITVGRMRALADKVDALIDASGADPAAPVALVPRNRPEILAALLGLLARGRHLRMIHVYQSPEGIARNVLRLKPATVLAMAQDLSEEVLTALKENGIAGIALAEMDAAAAPGCARSTAICDPPPPEPQIDLLTSGTTGPPKQFPITYEFVAREMVNGSPLSLAGDFDPLALPPAHLYWPFGNFSGLYAILTPMLLGMRGVLADRFSVLEVHDYVRRFRPGFIGLPPAGVQMVLDAGIPVEDFACLKFVRVGSAPLKLATHRAFEDRYGIPILQSYGATEFGGPVTDMPLAFHPEWTRKKIGSVGVPYRGAQLRVVDPDTGAPLAPGEQGLLEVIAPRMGPEWIRTSDLGIIDADGFVWHRGRADGAIVRGGFKLLPEAIEGALVLHDAVAAAMVTAFPDHRLGEVPAAAVVVKPGARQPSREELIAHLREHIEATHIPVLWMFVDQLPSNAMMKPDRAALRAMFEQEAIANT